jgi:hypothetical protein
VGREQRIRQQEARQALEIVKGDAGDMLDFGAYALGCPACGGFERQCKYHLGTALIGGSDQSDCHLPGRHLHHACQCGRMWITRCKSDPENATEAPSPIELMHSVLRAIARSAGADGFEVSDEELRQTASGSVFIEETDAGKLLKYRAP